MGKLKEAFVLLRDTLSEWNADHASTWAAALAYYTIFSIGPLLLIAISIAGLALGQAAAQGEIVGMIEGVVGQDGAQVIQGLLEAANKPREGVTGTVIGIATLLVGAAGFFGQLQRALNEIWEVAAPKRGLLGTVIARSLPFLMVLAAGVLLLALLVASTTISAVVSYFGQLLPAPFSAWLLLAVDFLVSVTVITVVFAGIYRFLPDTTIAWKDVWMGAAFTSILFTIGKIALGFYLGQASPGSAFGAAGSLVVLLVWIYYSAQIFLFGAEFTQVFANKYGPRSVPSENAEQPEAARDIAAHGGPPEAKGKGKPEVGSAAGAELSGGDQAGGRREKQITAWPGGPSYRPSLVRAVIMQLSVVVGVAAAAIGILRGRG